MWVGRCLSSILKDPGLQCMAGAEKTGDKHSQGLRKNGEGQVAGDRLFPYLKKISECYSGAGIRHSEYSNSQKSISRRPGRTR